MTFDKIKRCDADLLATYETILKNLGFRFATRDCEGTALIDGEIEPFSVVRYDIFPPEDFRPAQFQTVLSTMTWATPETHRLWVMGGWCNDRPGNHVRVDIYRRNFTDDEYYNDIHGELAGDHIGFFLMYYSGVPPYHFQCPQRICDYKEEVKE